MPQINANLAFGGNCREAMNFYKQCLGGELSIQTVGETPMARQMPPETHKNFMHAALTNGPLNLFGSDRMGPDAVNQGNTITLMINCEK